MNWIKSFCLVGILSLIVVVGLIISKNWIYKSSNEFQTIIEETVVPDLKYEILTLQQDVQRCYNYNKIRYEREFETSNEIERLISSLLKDNDELLLNSSKLDTLCKEYFDENYDNQSYAQNYLNDNVYEYSPSKEHSIQLNQLLLLYKTRNIMNAVHRNVCTGNDDSHLKKGGV